ncbi:MAG: hypothetical protein ACREDD_04490 [Methylocella sp.]
MPTREGSEQRKEEARKRIGQAIIDGLVTAREGAFVILQDYTQGEGGYWQSDGGAHVQSKGDYHQGPAPKLE